MEAENENQTLINEQFQAENENQTLKIKQLEAENFNLHQMLQDRNESHGNFNFLLILFLKDFWNLTKLLNYQKQIPMSK